MNTQQQPNQGHPIQPIQISNKHLFQEQTINQRVQNLSQQKSFSSTTATSATSTLCPTHSPMNSESYGQYNQDSDNNNNMMTTQALLQWLLYNPFTSLPAIYDNLNLNLDKLLCCLLY
nr:6414_t:CDS:1 [Entrophospora candida]